MVVERMDGADRDIPDETRGSATTTQRRGTCPREAVRPHVGADHA